MDHVNVEESRYDVAVIGAGPIGLGLARRLSTLTPSVCVVEAEGIAHRIRRFPEGMTLFSAARYLTLENSPIPARRGKDAVRREEFLQYLNDFAQETTASFHLHYRVDRLLAQGDAYLLEPQGPVPTVVVARFVVISIGSMATPRLLRVPGEDGRDIHHEFSRPADPQGRSYVVIGGRNSALGATIELIEAGARVTLVHRGQSFCRARLTLREGLRRAAATGRLRLLLDTRVDRFRDHRVELTHGPMKTRLELPFHRAFLMTGYDPDTRLYARSEIPCHGVSRRPLHEPESLETPRPNVFVAGAATLGRKDSAPVLIHHGRRHIEKIATAIGERLEAGGMRPRTALDTRSLPHVASR